MTNIGNLSLKINLLMPYDQGDIVLVPFPLSDLTGTKVRPAIVGSNVDINQTDDVILAAITTNLRNDEFSFRLDNSWLSRPMDRTSEVRCHKLFTCEQRKIRRVISNLTTPHIANLSRSIKLNFSTV